MAQPSNNVGAGQEQHTIIALVEDKPGVLTRIASMFRRRGFNIASLAVGRSEKPGLSRMTFVVDGDLPTVQQVTRQLDKLIDVIEVSYISTHQVVARELALIKVTTTAGTRGEIMQFAELFDANIVDVSPASMVVEITGSEQKVNSLEDLLRPFGITEMVRTGLVAMVRGQESGMGAENLGVPISGNGMMRMDSGI
jgi:acetolactate synthase-1/3 small subunit